MTTSTIPVLVFEILRVIERRTNEKKRNIAAKKSIITINEPLSNLL
jgi:hypothetical protein